MQMTTAFGAATGLIRAVDPESLDAGGNAVQVLCWVMSGRACAGGRSAYRVDPQVARMKPYRD